MAKAIPMTHNNVVAVDRVSRKAYGRKASQKSADTRKLILNCAADLFSERGYGLTKLTDIAEKAAIHLTALYYYYDNKEQLAFDVVLNSGQKSRRALEQAVEALPAHTTARRRIEVAIEIYLNSILGPDEFMRASTRIVSQISRDARDGALSETRNMNHFWEQLIQEAISEGAIRTDLDPKMIRMMLLGSMNWTVEWFRPELGSPAPYIKTLQAAIFEGIASPSV